MSGDSLFVGPDLMTKYGAMLNEPAELAGEILAQYQQEKDALGEKPWGHGDEMADVFESKFVPAERDFQDYVTVLVDVLGETAANTIHTAEQYRRSELGNEDISLNLFKDLPDSPDGLGDPGGVSGGGHGRR